MKIQFHYFTIAIILLTAFILFSCNHNKKAVAYQSPMHCQSDTVYANKGKCPVCEIDLEEV